MIEQEFCKFQVAGLIPVFGFKHLLFFIMSLLSQKDRKNVIRALDFLLFSKGEDMSEMERAELNALLNWIKLEYNKNEN